MLTIAGSGERKSTCDSFFTVQIRGYETAETEAAKPAIKNYKAALEIWEAKCGGIKDKIRQEAKGMDPVRASMSTATNAILKAGGIGKMEEAEDVIKIG